MAGSTQSGARNAANSQSLQTKTNKGGSGALNVVLVVLIALTVGYGFTVFRNGGSEVQAQSIENPEYGSDFLSSIIGEDSPDSPPNASYPHIVYEDGVLFVRGVASTEEEVAETVALLEPIFGQGNVIAEFLVDGRFTEIPDTPTAVYFADNVLFGSGSAQIDPEFEDVLAASAEFLQLTDETTIAISGHTDSNGTEESNLELSQSRVDAARQAMINAGGDPDRITAIGQGESSPIADNNTADGRQLNRRVELTIGSMGN